MSEYLVLIYDDEARWANAGAELWQQAMVDHNAFGEKNGEVLKGGKALQPTSTATTVRKDSSGSVTVTDGPFAETKEALGGYYLIEAADLDQAIEIAKQVPVYFGGVEVRPVMTFD
jgi:hypothetical protein